MEKQKVNFNVDMVVEIPKGSYIKYEFDKEKHAVRVDRVLHTMPYPFNYGYIPDTLSGDGDPLDVILLGIHALYPCSLVKVKVVGVLMTEDEKGVDSKLIAVMSDEVDPASKAINTMDDKGFYTIHGQLIEEISYFFAHYKDLEKEKWVKVHGYQGVEAAQKIYYEARAKN